MKGNIKYISNLYHVSKEILYDDVLFCQHVEDPECLFEMKCNPRFKWFNFTKRQEAIFRTMSGIACRKDAGDMPVGAVVCSDGLIRETCRCKKTDCEYFKECMSLGDTKMYQWSHKSSGWKLAEET